MTYTFPIANTLPALSLRREIDRLFDDVFVNRPDAGWQPAAEASEDGTGFTLRLDLPGVPADGVDVLAEDGVLTVKGARTTRELADGERLLFSEANRGAFIRRFRLPKSADLQQVEAAYTDGVLTVRIGKVAPAQPRKITVTVPR